MKKIVVIGGGPAGLTAAYELLKDNSGKYEVAVIEESEHLGGISKTVSYNGNRMDIGGHRFFSKEDSIMNWWSNVLPVQSKPALDDKLLGTEKTFAENEADPEKTDEVMLIRNRISRIYYNNAFF